MHRSTHLLLAIARCAHREAHCGRAAIAMPLRAPAQIPAPIARHIVEAHSHREAHCRWLAMG